MAPNHQGLREQHLRAPGSDNGPTILAALARMEANLATVAADVVGLAAGMTGLAADVDLVKNQVRFQCVQSSSHSPEHSPANPRRPVPATAWRARTTAGPTAPPARCSRCATWTPAPPSLASR